MLAGNPPVFLGPGPGGQMEDDDVALGVPGDQELPLKRHGGHPRAVPPIIRAKVDVLAEAVGRGVGRPAPDRPVVAGSEKVVDRRTT